MGKRICSAADCDRSLNSHAARGMCTKHYKRWYAAKRAKSRLPECSIPSCVREATANKGWCWTHYNKWRRHGDPMWGFEQMHCSVDACERTSRARGMCDTHYSRWKSHRDPSIRLTKPGGKCESLGCEKRSYGRGLCKKHWFPVYLATGGAAVIAEHRHRRRARQAGSTRCNTVLLSWQKLYDAGRTTCYLCSERCNPLDFRVIVNKAGRQQKVYGRTYPSLDHLVPLRKGGAHLADNVDLACRGCNSRKHALSTDEYWSKYGAPRSTPEADSSRIT